MSAYSFFFPFIPLYVQELGVRDPTQASQWAGLIAGAFSVTLAAAQPFWGGMADRWGRKLMVIRSMLGSGVVTILTGMAASVEQLLLLRIAQGAVTGTQGASNALVATSMPRERIGFALGLMQMSVYLGATVGPVVGGILADNLGFRSAFFAAGGFLLVSTVITVFMVHEDFRRPVPAATRIGPVAKDGSLMALPLFPLLVGVIFLIQLDNMVVSPVLSLFVVELSGGDSPATAAGTVMAATGLASAAASIVVGRIGDRLGHARILPLCLLGAALSCVPQAFVHQVQELLALRMLLGLFLGGLMPSANALVATVVPQERRGAAFGITSSAMALAGAAGPLLGAGVATSWGMRSVFLATATLFALTWCWTALSLRRRALPRSRSKATP